MSKNQTKNQTKKQQSKIQHPSSRVARKQAAYDTYVAVLFRVSYELARHRFKFQIDQAEDIAALVVEKFHRNRETNMAKYPTPEVYARVTTWHMSVSYERSERAQRCEGAHLVSEVQDDGTVVKRKGRTWASGHAPILDGDGILYDLLSAGGTSVEDLVVDSDETRRILDICFTGLTERQIDWVMKVDGYKYTAGQVAKDVKLDRCTVQREIGVAYKIMRANYEQMVKAS